MTSYEYDDQGRVLRTVTASPWTAEDRALLLAYEIHLASLCPKCGHPKDTAWHFDNEGEFEVAEQYTCHPCTVMAGQGDGPTEPVQFLSVRDTRDYSERPLPGHYTEFGSSDFHPTPATASPGSTLREEATL